jgi:hypothetical protein
MGSRRRCFHGLTKLSAATISVDGCRSDADIYGIVVGRANSCNPRSSTRDGSVLMRNVTVFGYHRPHSPKIPSFASTSPRYT